MRVCAGRGRSDLRRKGVRGAQAPRQVCAWPAEGAARGWCPGAGGVGTRPRRSPQALQAVVGAEGSRWFPQGGAPATTVPRNIVWLLDRLRGRVAAGRAAWRPAAPGSSEGFRCGKTRRDAGRGPRFRPGWVPKGPPFPGRRPASPCPTCTPPRPSPSLPRLPSRFQRHPRGLPSLSSTGARSRKATIWP